ncbi:hypothetical protein HY468_02080 [Candidatus Roizmanbacteria bacterium]|nr:hypothetical protein [Candidatus Roizmanbacteria bacterium]
MNPLEKIQDWYRDLPDKKKYFEVVTAFLSIPVLLTVLINNISNLENNKGESPTPTVTAEIEHVTYIPIEVSKPEPTRSVTPTISSQVSPTPSTQPVVCKKAVGPVDITSPQEGEIVSDNPVEIMISYVTGEYCAVVWSYRINNGRWSDYNDRSIALYNMPPGEKVFELRVKSIASGDEKNLTRTFVYQPLDTSPTVEATSSSSQ